MMLGIIPARAGSKTIPNKNITLLNGKPLLDYTVDAVTKSCLKDRYLLSTDSPYILQNYDECVWRPDDLATDTSKVIDTIKHTVLAYENYTGYYGDVTSVILLQPTSPLRDTEDIEKAIKLYSMNSNKCLYSGSYISIKETGVPFDKKTSNKHFQRNGAIFIADIELIKKGVIWDDNPIQFVMPKYKSIDIDDYEDLFMAESILKNRSNYV
jgi:CMP-N,N'-diacetyllegionaminic acid synthase